jgi:hypothetical protein
MKLRLPSLKSIVHGAHRMGATTNRFSVSPNEVSRIRAAEKKGDGLRVVLEILRERNQAKDRERAAKDENF